MTADPKGPAARPALAWRCPACRGRFRPKDEWHVNPRQGYIQCGCGRIPDPHRWSGAGWEPCGDD
jgi:hypothetical protein